MFLCNISAISHISSNFVEASCPASSGSNSISTCDTPCIFNNFSLSISIFLVPKQHITFSSPLSCKFNISNIPSTNITLPFIGRT